MSEPIAERPRYWVSTKVDGKLVDQRPLAGPVVRLTLHVTWWARLCGLFRPSATVVEFQLEDERVEVREVPARV